MSTKQDKYVIIKIDDVKAYLTATESSELIRMLNKINAGRAAAGKRVNRYVVLNASDPMARTAMDAYIEVASDPAVADKPGVRAIRDRMSDILSSSRMQDTEQLPD